MKKVRRTRRIHYAWVIMASCCCIATASIGIIYGVSANFLGPVTAELGCSNAALLLYVSVMSTVSMLLYPAAGKLLTKMNLRLLLTGAALLMCIGFGAMSFYTSVFQFYISGAIIGLGASVLMFMTIPYLTNLWFKKKVGFAMGFAMAFTGAGSAVFSPVCATIIMRWGYRTAYAVMALIALIIMLIPTLFLIRRPSEMGMTPYGADEVDDAQPGVQTGWALTLKEAVRTPSMWLLMAATLCFSVTTLLQQFHISYATKELGMTAIQGASLVSVVGLVAIAAKILLGVCNDRIGATKTAWLFGAPMAVGLGLMAYARNAPGLAAAAVVLYGCGYGLYNVEPPFMTRTLFGTGHYSSIWSFVMIAGSLGSALGSPLLGAIYDTTGTYTTVYLFTLLLLVAGLACSSASMGLGKRLARA